MSFDGTSSNASTLQDSRKSSIPTSTVISIPVPALASPPSPEEPQSTPTTLSLRHRHNHHRASADECQPGATRSNSSACSSQNSSLQRHSPSSKSAMFVKNDLDRKLIAGVASSRTPSQEKLSSPGSPYRGMTAFNLTIIQPNVL